jgi:hypothetical protein
MEGPMSLLHATALKIGSRRWELTSGAVFIVVLVIFGSFFLPWARHQVAVIAVLQRDLSSISKADTIPQAIARAGQRIAGIESTITNGQAHKAFNEAQVVAAVYALAESTGCAAAKVLVSEPVVLEHGVEIPLQVEGSGAYAAMGKFVAGIENLAYATRIRQLTLRRNNDESGTLSADFIIMDATR